MKSVLILVVLATFAFVYYVEASENSSLDAQWEKYKKDFSKSYKSNEDEEKHKQVYAQRVKEIAEHNVRYKEGKESYEKGINQFTDMTEAERKALLPECKNCDG